MATAKRTRRVISKSKMYGIHPWMDQVDAIDQIISETGVKESIVLRKLLDEALAARRKKAFDEALGQAASAPSATSQLSVLEDLLLRIIAQSETSLRMQDVSLALVQDTLAEARAGRKLTWEQMRAVLKEQGLTKKEIVQRFEDETEKAKDWAYGAAQEIKRQQENEE